MSSSIEKLSTVKLQPFVIDYVPEVFDLIDSSRAHLSQFDDNTSEKYPRVQALFDSVVRPVNPERERYVILEGEQEQVVGTINATPTGYMATTYEVGYWIGERHTGRGLATAAASLLLSDLLSRKFLRNAVAYTHPQNSASQHVLIKSGFENRGVVRRNKGPEQIKFVANRISFAKTRVSAD